MTIFRVLCASIVALVLAGCGQAVAAPTGTYPTVPDHVEGPFPVARVVDGDTIAVERDGQRQTIRLIGIDTPETRHPRVGRECYGPEASEQAHQLLAGRAVYLETDPSQDQVDRYGRGLAYVWSDTGRLVNLDLVSSGYAEEYTYRAPHKYQQQFRAAEAQARDNRRGMHSACSV